MKIKVYSTPSCPFCVSLKNFLKDNKIDFEEINVAKNKEEAEKMIEKSGQMGVPVLEVGDEIIVGFNKKKIMEVLNIK